MLMFLYTKISLAIHGYSVLGVYGQFVESYP